VLKLLPWTVERVETAVWRLDVFEPIVVESEESPTCVRMVVEAMDVEREESPARRSRKLLELMELKEERACCVTEKLLPLIVERVLQRVLMPCLMVESASPTAVERVDTLSSTSVEKVDPHIVDSQ
jgi:hypothetical protein